jgi:acetyl esterase/lipase
VGVEPVIEVRPGGSLRARLLHVVCRLFLRPLFACWPFRPRALRLLLRLDPLCDVLPRVRGACVEPAPFDGFCGEWVRAAGVPAEGRTAAVLYMHGGAFMFCGLRTHRRAVTRLSAATGLPVLSIAYRQLPLVPLRGSVADCVTAYRYLLAQGFAPSGVVFAGDSAGGHLAFATALEAVDLGLPKPAGIIAISPWLDLDATTKLAHPNAKLDAYAPAKRLPTLARMCAGGTDEIDPLLSPVNRPLGVLPPALIQVGATEMLRCDSELMAQRLGAAGVPCTLQIWEGQIHAFPVVADLVPEGRAAIDEMARFVAVVTARTAAHAA